MRDLNEKEAEIYESWLNKEAIDANAKNRNNYITELKTAKESAELILKQGNLSNTDILLEIIVNLMIEKAKYELSKEKLYCFNI